MLSKEKKKHCGSNINININFKVETKGQVHGKKINASKDVKKMGDLIRPNTQYSRKKSQYTQNTHNKQSIQEFVDDRTMKYEKQDENNNAFANMDRHEVGPKIGKNTVRKRLKSKSLQNLKVRYYARTPEAVSRSNSKMTSKSKSKMQSRSQSIGNSKSKSKKKLMSNSKSSPRSFLHSDKKVDKKRSKSKSPILNKKRSLQGFKLKGEVSSREMNRDRSKEKRWEKNVTTCKKNQQNQLSQPSFEKGAKTSGNNMRRTMEVNPQKKKNRKSSQNLKPKAPSATFKHTANSQRTTKPKKSKKPKQTKIFPPLFLNKMALRIQSYWRGYRVRNQLKEELTQIAAKINMIKNEPTFKQDYWESRSGQSITPVEIESVRSSQLIKNKSESQRSNSSCQVQPQFVAELEKLRKKLEEQQDRFKMLAQQNNELRANLSKINQQPSSIQKSQKPSKQLIVSHNVISMRIQSQESEVEVGQEHTQKKIEKSKRRRQQMLQLPSAIKTEQSKQQDYSELKKKVQSFECSPKNQDFNLKFNQTLLKKILSQQEERITQKYFRKNNQFKNLLQNQLVSPKTYHQKCSQLQLKLQREKEQNIHKYKQAEKALLYIKQLQEEQNSSFIGEQNQNKYANVGESSLVHHISPPIDSPKKTVNLVINVDQIESNTNMSHPMIVNNSHRSPEQHSQIQELSQLYQKAMTDKVDTKRRDIYLQGQEQHEHHKHQSQPEHFEHSEAPSIEESTMNAEVAHYPQFQLSNRAPQPPILKGFETTLAYIRYFYIRFCQYFRQINSFKDEIFGNISQPITFDEQLYLRSFRIMNEDENNTELVFPYFKYLATYNTVVPVSILNSYYGEITNQDSTLYQRQIRQMKLRSKEEYQTLGYSSYELKQYYDLALIDAFNQAINYERPGGSQASNLDELTHDFKTIYFNKINDKISQALPDIEREQNCNILLGNTIGKIVNIWACSLCGFINDCTEEDEQKIEESKLEEIRTGRLNMLLEKSLNEDENTFVNMKPFWLYVKLQVTRAVANQLMNEFTQELVDYIRKRTQGYLVNYEY